LIHDLIDDFIDAPWKVPGKEKDMQVESTSATVSNSPQVSTSTAKRRDMRVQCHRSNLPVSRPEIEDVIAQKAWSKKSHIDTLYIFILVHKSKWAAPNACPLMRQVLLLFLSAGGWYSYLL
jgi:hypothetical protein